MKNRTKRLLAIVLSVAMLVPTMPTMVLAESIADTSAGDQSQVSTEAATSTDQATESAAEQTTETQTTEQATEQSSDAEDAEAPPAAKKKSAELQGDAPSKVETYYTGSSQLLVNNFESNWIEWGWSTKYYRYVYTLNGTRYPSGDGLTDYASKDDLKRIDVGTYTITYQKQLYSFKNGWENNGGSTTITSYIKQATTVASVTPVSTTLEATGAAQQLIGSASTNFGTIQYQVNGGAWSTEKPTATAIGTYNINWKVDGTDNYSAASGSCSVEIAAKVPTVAITAKTGLVFNNTDQQLLQSGTTTYGLLEYSLTNGTADSEWTANIADIKAKNAGTHTVYYRVKAGATWAKKEGSVDVEIDKADLPANAVVAARNLVYNGKQQNLADETNLPDGCNAYYKTGYVVGSSTDESDAIPTEKDVVTNVLHDHYYVYYRIDGGQNYKNKDYDTGFAGIWGMDFEVAIDPAPIKSIEFNETLPYTYTGSEQTVSIKKVLAGKDGDLVECPSDCYNVDSESVLKGTAVGTYTVSVEAKGSAANFTGSKSTDWKIDKSYKFTNGALTLATSEGGTFTVDGTSFEYTGSKLKPAIKMMADGDVLSTEYYDLSGDLEHTNEGTHTITATGKGAYAGNTATATWEICQKKVTEAEISWTEKTYNFTNQLPEVTDVKDSDGNTLTEENYSVTYKNAEGTEVTQAVNAGTYTVVISGTGIYGGSVEKTFTIKKADLPADLVSENNGLMYNGKDQELAKFSDDYKNNCGVGQKYDGVKVTFKTYKGTEYVSDLVESTSIPTKKDADADVGYAVFYKIDGGNNYNSIDYKKDGITGRIDVRNFTASIAQAPIYSIELDNTSFTYDGQDKTVAITKVLAGTEGATVEVDSSYYYTYDKDSKLTTFTASGVGTYYVNIAINPISLNFTTGDNNTATWKIEKAYKFEALEIRQGDDWKTTGATFAYTGEEIEPEIRVRADGEKNLDSQYYTVSGDTKKSAVNDGSSVYTITVTGKGDYARDKDGNINTASATWTICKGIIDSAEIDASWTTPKYDGKDHIPSLVVKNTAGKELTKDEDYAVVYKDKDGNVVTEAKNAGTYTAYVTGINDYYHEGEEPKTVQWTIDKADITGYSITAKEGLKYTGKAQDLVSVSGVPEGCTVYYTYISSNLETRSAESTTIPQGTDAYYHDKLFDRDEQIAYGIYYRIDGGNNYNDVDYSLSLKPNCTAYIAKGTPVVHITGTSDLVYSGSQQQLIESVYADFGENSVTLDSSKLMLRYKKSTDSEWSEWTASSGFAQFTGEAAGTYLIAYKVEEDLNWEGIESADSGDTKHAEIEIAQKSIKDNDIEISVKNYPYSEDGQKVEVTVTDTRLEGDKRVLVEGTDYELSGDIEETEPGEYTVTIKGIGNYKDTVDKKWKILNFKAYLVDSEGAELNPAEFEYDGKLHSVNVKVTTVEGTPLEEGAEGDYVVLTSQSTMSATNAGKYTVKIQCLGEYESAGTIDLTWEIKKEQLAETDFLYKGLCLYVWNGKEHSVELVGWHWLDGRIVKLVEGEDYEITEDSVTTATDAGVYTVTVKGIGNYEGTISKEWRIQGIPIGAMLPLLDEDTFTYNGKKQGPTLTVGFGYLKENEDYVIVDGSITEATDAGEYKITVKGKGKFYGTKELTWKIEGRDIAKCVTVVQYPRYDYDGNYKTPTITIYDFSAVPDKYQSYIKEINTKLEAGTQVEIWAAVQAIETLQALAGKYIKTLELGKDYTLSEITAQCENGAYPITITGINNYSGTLEKEWVIGDSVKDDGIKVTGEYTYNANIQTPSIINGSGENVLESDKYTVQIKDGEELSDNLERTDAGTYTLVIKGNKDMGKYGTVQLEWTIDPKEVTVDWDEESTTTTYNGQVQRPVLVDVYNGFEASDIEAENVKITEAKAISIVAPKNAGKYYMYARVEFKDGFNAANYDIVDTSSQASGNKLIDYINENILSKFDKPSDSIEKIVEEWLNDIIGKYTDDKYYYTEFNINKRPVGVNWSNYDNLVYNGIKQGPTAEPTKASEETGERGLIDGDYCSFTVEGWEKDAGTYAATVSGLSFVTGLIGNYELDAAENTCRFTIAPKDIGDSTVVGIQKLTENLIYNAETQSPTLSVTDLAITALDKLYEDKDYEIDEGNKSCQYEAVNAGDYTIIIKGIGNYTGTRSIDWDIAKRSILSSDVDISLSSDSLVYNAETQGPTVSFTYKGVPQATSQYIVSGTTEAKDVYNILGVTDYTMYITGTGNFWGIVQRDWDIVPLDLSEVTPEVTFVQKTYNGEFQMPEATEIVVNGDEIPVDETRFTLLSARKSAGEHQATLVGNTKLNRYLNFNVIGETVVDWEILPKKATEDAFDIDMGTYVYNAEDQRANPTIVDQETGETLVEGVDYELIEVGEDQQVEANAAGTYELTIAFKGNYDGSFTENWTIQQKAVTVTALDAEKYFDSVNPKDPDFEYTTEGTVGGYEILEEDVSFTRELQGEPEGELVGKYKITMSVATDEYPNYDITLVNDAYLTIKAHEYKLIEGDGQKLTYGSDGSITFRANGEYKFFEGVEIDGKEITKDSDYTSWRGSTYVKLEPAYAKTLAVGEHTITVSYMDGSCTGTFTIAAAQNTGDSNNIIPWAILLIISIIALAGYGLKKREE